MIFPSGVKVSEERTTLSNPAEAWAALAAQDPGIVTVGTAKGQVASLTDPEKDPSGTAAGGVEFVLNKVQIAVAGNGSIPLPDLQRVAESLSR